MRPDQFLRSLRRILKRYEGALSPREVAAIIEAHNYIESREESDLRFKVVDHLDGNPSNLNKPERDWPTRRAKCMP